MSCTYSTEIACKTACSQIYQSYLCSGTEASFGNKGCFECSDFSAIGNVLQAWIIAVIVIGVLIFLGIIGCIIGCVCGCFRAARPKQISTYVVPGQNQVQQQQIYQPQQQIQMMSPQQVPQNYPQPPVLPAEFQ
ncbi:Cysteine_and tyrosine-rich protein 1 [Hexamita inflata]|uniref:Cysteine and tyrosine-rich protein 1 n=1 Tax=Hexamita inflata TaxID=28002 RepID=A0AA86UEQ6_9EUKA|nr:Cysteine and tyrosine-rich protein 1 [Hexamita inflata]